MKKKLIQILMLAFVAVSIGSFVSCKDTNEDLYNQLRTDNVAQQNLLDYYQSLIAGLDARIPQNPWVGHQGNSV